MILILDNYDSFTYNLVDYFNQLGEECEVVRNNISPYTLDASKYSSLVLSPGPGRPEDAGFLMEYIKVFEKNLPIIGICLGHQAIASYFGANVSKALKPMHGKLSQLHLLEEDELFRDMEKQFAVVRYHSLIINNIDTTVLKSLAVTTEGENMIFKHQHLSIYGIQYHPEAALTEYGLKILANWKKIVDTGNKAILN